MSDHLLPPNASPAEIALSEASEARFAALPVPVDQLWHPATCPASHLPWLAWACSVDHWDDTWPEATQRAVIAASYSVHRRKGTVGAVRRALAAAGFDARLIEWHQATPPGDPFTFGVQITVTDRGADASAQADAEAVALSTKNVRSHLEYVALISQRTGTLYLSAVAPSGEDSTIYPWQPGTLAFNSPLYLASAHYSAETVSIYPEAA